MHPPDLDQQLRVANRPGAPRSLHRRVVGARGDLSAVLVSTAQIGSTPKRHHLTGGEPVMAMLVDELHERGDGRSSSAAKKAEAVFKIAFARRSSRFSALEPPSADARRGQPRPGPGVDLSLLDPTPQRVAVDAQLLARPCCTPR